MLVRNAAALERLATVDTLVVDKTGTLTEGKPALTGVETMPGFATDEVLRLAASLEAGSEHPLAAAILRGAEARGLKLDKVEDFGAVTGQGVKGRDRRASALLGNQRLMEGTKIDPSPLAARPRRGGKRARR